MTSFGGGTNVPSWVALERGFFLKEGLKVTQEVTHGSKEQMQDIMAGKYQFASTAFDNIVAYTEGEGTDKFPNYDVVAIMGVHSGMNSLVARPEIKKYSDLKGKVVAVDSPTSGYATVFYQIVKEKTGLEKDKDYTTNSVGGTGARVKALKDGTGHAAMISSPNDMQLKEEGFTILGDAATEIGALPGQRLRGAQELRQVEPEGSRSLHPRHGCGDRLRLHQQGRHHRGAEDAHQGSVGRRRRASSMTGSPVRAD